MGGAHHRLPAEFEKGMAEATPPGHECPGYDGTKKPAEAGSWGKIYSSSRLQTAFRLERSPGIDPRADRQTQP